MNHEIKNWVGVIARIWQSNDLVEPLQAIFGCHRSLSRVGSNAVL